jgi:hypothetical protein
MISEFTECEVDSHRFNFLLSNKHPCFRDTKVNDSVRVQKTMCLKTKNAEIWIECHDGVTHGVESSQRLSLCWNARDRSKKFFYVKPNVDKTHGIAGSEIEEFLRVRDIKMISTSPWSYYRGAWIHSCRDEIRKHRTASKHKVSFLGALKNSGEYDRVHDISVFRNKFSNLFISDSLQPIEYVGAINESEWTLHPHGIGVRHALYESMALGCPGIVPNSVYLHSFLRDCHLVYDKAEDVSQFLLRDPHREKLCVELYEMYMTPEAIIQQILTGVNE